VANATFLMSLNPVFFALVQRYGGRCGAWFSARFAGRSGARAGAGRPLPPYILASLGLAVGGAAWLLAAGSGSLGRLGDLLVLAACLLYVGYLLAARRVAGDLPHLAFAHLLYFWGGLAGLPAALLAGGLSPAVLGDARSLAALAGLVLFPTLVGHTALSFGVRHLKPLTVSFFALAEPLVATAAALLLLGEAPPAAALPAYGLLLAAALLYLLAAARRGEG
jgi:drug/metabolite transporter (DMT)-like permease